MKQFFTIGQLSKLFNVKISALRYYDEIGLLKPAKINHQTNYRYYSTEQFERLNVINYLRALDLPVESIKHFFEARDIDKLEEMLKDQKVQVQQQILTLKILNAGLMHESVKLKMRLIALLIKLKLLMYRKWR